MAFPSEQKRLDSRPRFEVLSPELPASSNEAVANPRNASYPERLVDYVSATVLETLPNDLTRMIYLASLRDCNSGIYLHSELSHQRGIQAVDGALRVCHEQVFRRL